MAITPDALFSYLLEDVSPYCGPQVVSLLAEEASDLTPVKPRDRFEAASLSLVSSFYKKFVEVTNSDAEANSWLKFKRMNDRCADFDTIASCYFSDRSQLQSWDDQLIGQFRKVLHETLFPLRETVYDYDEIFDRGRHGPGASLQTRGSDSYSKFFSSAGSTASKFLAKHFRARASQDARWSEALEMCSSQYGDPVNVLGSSLSFVPKSRETMRSICVEPSLNMFYQLGLGSLFEDRLKSGFGIDLAVQPDHNRWLTRQGSIDGSFATIDLSSASDTISLKLLERVLDRDLFKVLLNLRSKQTTYKGETVALHMMSTMGNGFTFPLQTLIFASVVVAVYNILDIPVLKPDMQDAGNFGVFGDDIVCVKDTYELICRLLSMLGFIVNSNKSFNEGPFRESCGQDWYSGTDIRGVYVKTLRSRQDLFVLINRLNDFTARTGVSLPKTVRHLLTHVPYQTVPLGENDDAGVKVPLSMVQERKLNKHVQAIEYRADRAREASISFDHDECKVFVPKGNKSRIYNPVGFWLCALAGWVVAADSAAISSCDRISVRFDTTVYRTRRCTTPNWDFVSVCSAPKAVRMDRRLSDAIEANLIF